MAKRVSSGIAGLGVSNLAIIGGDGFEVFIVNAGATEGRYATRSKDLVKPDVDTVTSIFVANHRDFPLRLRLILNLYGLALGGSDVRAESHQNRTRYTLLDGHLSPRVLIVSRCGIKYQLRIPVRFWTSLATWPAITDSAPNDRGVEVLDAFSGLVCPKASRLMMSRGGNEGSDV